MSSGLTAWGLYSSVKRPVVPVATVEGLTKNEPSKDEISATQPKKQELSIYSQHTLIKPPVTVQKTYPEELLNYVKENKQSGPKVAKCLRQMYEEGLKGNEKYSPENCRDIAQKYLDYVKYINRHFILTDVNTFLQEMNELVKQKGEAVDQLTLTM